MTLARRLHEMIHALPMSYTQAALLWAVRSDWSEESYRTYLRAMPREELEDALVILGRTVAAYPGGTEGAT